MNKKIQILRAISIIAVVLIHTCGDVWKKGVLLRPFLNFCVALFLFLSGYLTKNKIENIETFYKKRIFRVFMPYLIWTIIYSIAYDEASKIIRNIITSQACYTLYYIAVYIQFVLITPIVLKLANSKFRWIGWMIQPISIIIIRYVLLLIGHPLVSPWNGYFCIVWFSYYYLGILLGNNIIKISGKKNKYILFFVASIMLQLFEGLMWYSLGNEDMATTQIKLSTMITSMITLILGYIYIRNVQTRGRVDKLHKLLIYLGDCSFGIYLSHPIIISIFYKIPYCKKIIFPINSVIVMTITVICIYVGRKLLGEKLGKYIGLY